MKKPTEATKRIASVTDVSRQVGLSRSRFYELMEQGIFPKPLRHPSTNRPYFDEALQAACLQVRKSNCGIDGQPFLFYSRRRNRRGNSTSHTTPTNARQRDPLLVELRSGLEQLGLNSVADDRLQAALEASYPDGHEDQPMRSILMTVFRQLVEKLRDKS